MATSALRANSEYLSVFAKLGRVSWPLVLLTAVIASIGFTLLYSAAGADFDKWAASMLMRYLVGLGLMFMIAVVDLKFWLRSAYFIYLGGIALLVIVELQGVSSGGATRWIALPGGTRLQPSEIMKIGLVIALARYFHSTTIEEVGKIRYLIAPIVLMMIPAAMVLKQPDLGTTLMLMATGVAVLFIAGVRMWKFATVGAIGLLAIPIAWASLKDYQKQRVLTFLDPESDPLGSGYHIIQSKIALGSGGIAGKGFLKGTQSHLNFLPEQQTDFIFTILAEEFGLMGGLFLLGVFAAIVVVSMVIAVRSRNQFGRILAMGLSINFFLYFFINLAMVMGLIPVVGVPLPMVSYGGTVMIALMVGFGFIQCVHVHRDLAIHRTDTS